MLERMSDDPLPRLNKFLEDQEYDYLCKAMTLTNGNGARAARIAGRDTVRFYKRLKQFGLSSKAFRKQTGFIGGIYVYIGLAIAAAALAGVCYVVGRSDGRALERALWTEQQNADLRAANVALDHAHQKIRAHEQAAAEKVAAVSRGYQKDLENANRAKTLAMDALRASGGLRVAVTGCKADDAGTGEAASGATGRDGGASTGLLAETDGAFLVSEASRADAVTLQLLACQRVVRADRGLP